MRRPFSLYNLNKELLESGIGIVAAQHLEGGLEALLYMKTDDFEDVVTGALLFFARSDRCIIMGK